MPTIATTTDADSRLAEAREAESNIAQLDEEIESAKAALKTLKEEREAAVDRLRGIVRDGDRPLLDGDSVED